jgi:hypothetical protein
MLAPFTQFKKINVRPSRLLIIFNVMKEAGKCVDTKETPAFDTDDNVKNLRSTRPLQEEALIRRQNVQESINWLSVPFEDCRCRTLLRQNQTETQRHYL